MSVHVAPSATDSKTFQVPTGVFCEVDPHGRQWTDIAGAAVWAGKSRRTISQWIANGWVVIRRTASGKPQILVASLWQESV